MGAPHRLRSSVSRVKTVIRAVKYARFSFIFSFLSINMSALKGIIQDYTTILDGVESKFAELENRRDAYLDAIRITPKNELARKTAFQLLTMTFTAITQNSLPLSTMTPLLSIKQQPLTEPIKTFALDARRRVLGLNQRLITICDSLKITEEKKIYTELNIKDFKLRLAMNAKHLREIAGEEKPTVGGNTGLDEIDMDFNKYGIDKPNLVLSTSKKISAAQESALLQELETPTVGGKARRARPRATKKRI
jgi:hypothetical protein